MKHGIQNIGRHAVALNIGREHLRLVIQGKRPDPNGILPRYHALIEAEKRLESEQGLKFRGGYIFGLDPKLSGADEEEMRQYCRREGGMWVVEKPFAVVPSDVEAVTASEAGTEIISPRRAEGSADPAERYPFVSKEKRLTRQGEMRRTKHLKAELEKVIAMQKGDSSSAEPISKTGEAQPASHQD